MTSIGKKNHIEIDHERNMAILYLPRRDSFLYNERDTSTGVRVGFIPVYMDNDMDLIAEVDKHRWSARYANGVGCLPYAVAAYDVYMHRLIWQLKHGEIPAKNDAGEKLIVDHKNKLRHDNRSENLALITDDENWRKRRTRTETPHYDPNGYWGYVEFPSESRAGELFHAHVYVYNIWIGHFAPHETHIGNHVMHMAKFLLDERPCMERIREACEPLGWSREYTKLVVSGATSALHWKPPFLSTATE